MGLVPSDYDGIRPNPYTIFRFHKISLVKTASLNTATLSLQEKEAATIVWGQLHE